MWHTRAGGRDCVAAVFPVKSGDSHASMSDQGPPRNRADTVSGGAGAGVDPSLPPQLGPYRIERLLGRGGMAAVYLARDVGAGHQVALKVVTVTPETDASVLERFKHEVHASSQLKHRNVVGAFAWGEQDGRVWLATEYMDGGTVRELLGGVGHLPPPLAAELTAQLLAGLSEAHRRGIVHRDLKPENLLLASAGVLKVADFGIARVSDQTRLTATGMLVGTAQYMSPEQVRGLELDGRSDLFTVGTILYELLAGTNPFEAETPVACLQRVLGGTVPPLSEARPATPEALEAVLDRLLSFDASTRFQSAEEALHQLEPLLAVQRRARPMLVADALREPKQVKAALDAEAAAALVVRAEALAKGDGPQRTHAALVAWAACAADPSDPKARALLDGLLTSQRLYFGPPRNPKIGELELLLLQKRDAPALLLQLAQLYRLEGNALLAARMLRRYLRAKPGDAYVGSLWQQLLGERPPGPGAAPKGATAELVAGIRTGGFKAMEREPPVGQDAAAVVHPPPSGPRPAVPHPSSPSASSPRPSGPRPPRPVDVEAELAGLKMHSAADDANRLGGLLRRGVGLLLVVGVAVLALKLLGSWVESTSKNLGDTSDRLARNVHTGPGGPTPDEPRRRVDPLPGVQPIDDAPDAGKRLKSNERAQAMLDTGQRAWRQGSAEDALSAFRGVVAGYPDTLQEGEALHLTAQLRLEQQLPADARGAWDELVTRLPTHPRAAEALLRRGQVAERLVDYDAADADYTAFIAGHAQSTLLAEAYLSRGLLHRRRSHTDEARADLEEAVRRSDASDDVRAQALRALAELSQ